MPYLDQERTLANLLANVYPLTIDDTEQIHFWFTSLDEDQLKSLGLDSTAVARVIELQLAYRSRKSIAHGRSFRIRLSFSDFASTGGLGVGDKVLIIPLKDGNSNVCALWTLKGKMVATFTLPGRPVPQWWERPDLVVSSVTKMEPSPRGPVVLIFDTSEV